ncbi:MAG TPA: hypothetical protein VGS97_23460 [Actinocrinis sp.]|uniref:hypothetical protein n=1 Tax=Actinocrinis sp. TaxID=1920516 RepID=UPI002DDCFCD3|nr:hypothetical protein [Actinocrinis sp.]HEV2347078.1 hypothetical protein [Actinocrinis sp.]
MSLNDAIGPDGFDFDEVDSLVETMYQELLDRTRSSVDPAASLAEIMSTAPQAPQDQPDACGGRRQHGSGLAEALIVAEPIDLDLAFVLCFGDVIGRTIDATLDLMHALTYDPNAGHARELCSALMRNATLARDFEPTRASAGEMEFALELATPADLADDLDRADDLDWARIVARARFLDFARIFALCLTRALESEAGPALDLARHVAELLTTASDVALRRTMVRNLKEIRYVNAAGRDMSWLDAYDMPMPVGTIWDAHTILPPAQAAKVEAHSIKIGRGLHRLQPI